MTTDAVVMIVDDNPNNLKVLGDMLEQAGYGVRPALSGELALRALRSAPPDLVLLDIRMPEMDGYEVCRRIRAEPALAELPVIFISALQDMEDKVQAFQAGGVDYIVKPFRLEEVLVRVRTHLELARARLALRSVNARLEERVAERTRALEESNAALRFSMQEEHVLGELLALGLQHTPAADFLEAVPALLDRRTEWSGAGARTRLVLNRASALLDRLDLEPARWRPRRRFLDGDRFARLAGSASKAGRHLATIEAEGGRLGLLVHHAAVGPAPAARWAEFMARVGRAVSLGLERRLADDRIEFLAYHDELTGLPNRRLLSDRLGLELAHARRHGHVGALLFLDLDRFKTVNDALGHAVGDLYLAEVGRRFRAALRAEDTLARWSGDGFLVLLPSLAANPQEAARHAHTVAEGLAARLAETVTIEGHDLRLDASVGITLFPLDGNSSDELLSHADTAMYQAKQAGRNAICFYEPGMQAMAEGRLRLEKDLRLALERDEFTLYFQPQTDADGGLRGCEALVRWNHPERGLLGPAEFIPLAEDSGLIMPLGTWVLRRAAEQQVRWLADPALAARLGRVSVNVSSRQFHQADFVARVEAVLQATGLDPGALELEVTESLLLVDIDDTIAKMARLKVLGLSFAIDDFGTGYSSLAYLKRLPIDRLKIDQSFVRNVERDPQGAAIVGAIIAMAHHLQLGLIAEGVETEAEWAFLRAAGCPAFQGYLFGRPMPAAAIAALAAGSPPERTGYPPPQT